MLELQRSDFEPKPDEIEPGVRFWRDLLPGSYSVFFLAFSDLLLVRPQFRFPPELHAPSKLDDWRNGARVTWNFPLARYVVLHPSPVPSLHEVVELHDRSVPAHLVGRKLVRAGQRRWKNLPTFGVFPELSWRRIEAAGSVRLLTWSFLEHRGRRLAFARTQRVLRAVAVLDPPGVS